MAESKNERVHHNTVRTNKQETRKRNAKGWQRHWKDDRTNRRKNESLVKRIEILESKLFDKYLENDSLKQQT